MVSTSDPPRPPRRWRRVYHGGQRCQDCGQLRRTTVVRFWVNDYRYRVCADCIRAYRGRLLTHHPPEVNIMSLRSLVEAHASRREVPPNASAEGEGGS